jgi:hypothetical protein
VSSVQDHAFTEQRSRLYGKHDIAPLRYAMDDDTGARVAIKRKHEQERLGVVAFHMLYTCDLTAVRTRVFF